jgi:hypothetical protein
VPKSPSWLALAALTLGLAAIHAQEDSNSRQGTSSDETEKSDIAAEPSPFAAPLPRGKKLILTDGSFQIVREYERQGERARYYSVERSAWEEIPAELVDWAATDKAEAESEASRAETLDRLHSAATSELSQVIDTGSSLLVGSGVFLPDLPGFYVLDGQTVLGLTQVEAESRIDKGRAILKGLSGLPFLSSKRHIEVTGKHAQLRIHSPEPEFFIRTDDGRSPQLALVRAEIDGDKRRVTTAVVDMVGQTTYTHVEVAMLASEVARGVQRLVMAKKLEPGEYALLETTSEGLSLYVWEFGVDPAPRGASQTDRTAPAKSTAK